MLDATDFPAGAAGVTIPATSDFKPGDPVTFTKETAGANLDSALAEGTTYLIGVIANGKAQILIRQPAPLSPSMVTVVLPPLLGRLALSPRSTPLA